MTQVQLEHVSFSYPQAKTEALSDISFSIEQGEYIAIVGTNGSGKSTLARILAKFYETTSGTYNLYDKEIPGIVFQSPKEQIVSSIVNCDTAFGPENLGLSKAEIELRTIECLSLVSLSHKALSRTNELSLGQTQRLAFAGTLALFPSIMILDEVTAMLDPVSKDELMMCVNQWNKKGHTIIHITHDESEALRCNRVIALEKGKIIFDGTSADFMNDKKIFQKIFSPEAIPMHKKTDGDDKTKNETSLTVENLCFNYDENPLIKNLSFTLKKGTVTALTGSSSCGKSTLFEILAGLQKPMGGKISALERPVLALQESEAALYRTFAGDDVAFGPINNGVKNKELLETVKKSMNLAGLPFKDYANRGTFQLSGGEKRKLSLAGLIALNKDIMIFDEPTAGLDSMSKIKVLSTLRQLADEGKTILFSTHRMDEIRIADFHLNWEEINNFKTENAASENDSQTENKLKPVEAFSNSKLLSTLKKSMSILSVSSDIKNKPAWKLPSLVKLILFISLFVCAMFIKNLVPLSILLFSNIAYSFLCKVSPKKFGISLKIFLPWILIFGIIEAFIYRDIGYILWEWGLFRITDTAINQFIFFMMRSLSVILCITSYAFTTTERELIDGLKILLYPLSLIKIPVRYFIIILEIIFRFIPLLFDELSCIIKTQLIRGSYSKVKGIKKFFVFTTFLVPLLLQTIRKAQNLADALTARRFS